MVYYYEEAWKDTINIASNPTNWFGGESATIGAKNKITVLGVSSGYSGKCVGSIFCF